MKIREAMYKKGIFKQHKLEVPVISVGNLTMGGTGKTPATAFLAAILRDKGYRPAIISRGYGGKATGKVNIVSDNNGIHLDAGAAGDEPCFLAHALPGIHVLTGVVRILPCRYAVEKAGCDVIILDDGFQHLAIHRDLDLVLFSASKLAGNSRVFPGGDLREPVSALKRCSAFLITGVTNKLEERADRFQKLLKERFPDKPIFFTQFKAVTIVSLQNGTVSGSDTLPDSLFGFCGIAQPQVFQNTLNDMGATITGFKPLKDHQIFTPELLLKIEKMAVASGASALICTEKDFVKLKKDDFKLPCYALQMRLLPSTSLESYLEAQTMRLFS